MTISLRPLAIFAIVFMQSYLSPLLWADETSGKDYLSTGKLLEIGVGSTIPLVINYAVSDVDSTQRSLIPRPVLADRWLQRKLGGQFHVGKNNFLDHSFGSAITPGIAGLTLIAANFTWPQGKPAKDAGQDFLIFHSGLMATKGVTGVFKGLVARPRPYLYFFPDSAFQHDPDMKDARKSFFSGHASSAFFSATYLNKRLRDIMRQRLSGNQYSDWNWAPPVILFGWSSFVGLSRMHSYYHYFSDVVIGAVAGYLIGELFYGFGDQCTGLPRTFQKVSPIFHLSFAF